jgi:ATP-dependent Zn protease
MAKAMAREAGVPFLFVSSSAFQSMYFGQTNRKIRSFFRELREAARREGGAIGFIEEIDAIAGARSGMRAHASPSEPTSIGGRTINADLGREGISGIVNELLIQLQSFDTPTRSERFRNSWIALANRWLPSNHQIDKPAPLVSNVLVIGATNRATDLDPALLRPGRFDRSIHFGLPSKAGRRELIDYYLGRKAHTPELDKDERRDQLAAMTFGYSPAMVEHLLDESLVWALREAREAMSWRDVQQAKLTEEIGLQQPVEYTLGESDIIATHESGHAVVAYLMGPSRKLEMLSIVKRRDALGLLAHSDTEERFTRTRSELVASIHIAFGGMVAEELFFGETGTGPAGDLASATQTAARMVGQFGMAGSLISFDAVESGPITQGIVGKVLADDEARHAVERILLQAQREVRDLLDGNRHLVVALRDALLDQEELVGDEILAVLRTAELRHELEPPPVAPEVGNSDGSFDGNSDGDAAPSA